MTRLPIARFALPLGLCFANPAIAQDSFSFSIEPVTTCLGQTAAKDQAGCAGLAANLCMQSNDGGETTVGMSTCLGKEADFWDAELNAVYAELSAREKANDAEMAKIGATVPPVFSALRDMQRAWIPYRDALCAYDYSHWGGGTGGGPASVSCFLHETARQVAVLRTNLEGWN